MKVCVFTSNGWESAERLAKKLDIPVKKNTKDIEEFDLAIRYGNRTSLPIKVLNSLKAVHRCVDRKLFARVIESAGVRNPYIVDWRKVPTRQKLFTLRKIFWKKKYPKYLYSLAGSQQGRGIVLVQSKYDEKVLKELDWNWSAESRWIPVKQEWRVHIIKVDEDLLNGLVQRKVAREVHQFMFFVRNVSMHRYKYEEMMTLPNLLRAFPDDVTRQAMKAFTACGLDFGAVDVIEDVKGKAWVVDVNSAPGLIRSNVLKFYVENLAERLKNEGW